MNTPYGNSRVNKGHITWVMFGTVIFANLALVCGLSAPASAQPLPPNTYQLSLHSQPDDPWSRTSGKSNWFYQAGDGQFLCQGFDWVGDGSLNHLTFLFRGNNGDIWQMAFTTPGELTPGTYDNAQRNGYPGLDVGGLGGACLTATGKFRILDLAYQGSRDSIRMTRFAATFEFHCYGLPPALTGTIYFNSNGFPPPAQLVMKGQPTMADGTVGSDYSQKIEVEGGTPPYLSAINSGQLPPGLLLDENGLVRGIPTTRGKYTFNIGVVDSASLVNGYPSQSVSGDFSITVSPAIFSIEEGLAPTASKGIPYTYQFVAIGGVLPYKWILVEGQFPSGLTLSDEGKLSGVPSALGVFTFTLQASDSVDHQAQHKYTIRVIDPPRIIDATYKKKKGKLTITGGNFDDAASLLIDGQKIKPKHHDSESFTVKSLSLSEGPHDLRIVNPDGGTASVTITVE